MPVVLRYASGVINRVEPVYHTMGKFAHTIRRVGNVYRIHRANMEKYRFKPKVSPDFATPASALAWAQADYNNLRPATIAPTTTTAGYTQPAVGATVVVPVTAATGLLVGQYVTIATGGKYEITAIGGLNITVKNLLPAPDNAAPTTVIATAKAFTVVPAW